MTQLVVFDKQRERPAFDVNFHLPRMAFTQDAQGLNTQRRIFQDLINLPGCKVGDVCFHVNNLWLKPVQPCLNMPTVIREDYFINEEC